MKQNKQKHTYKTDLNLNRKKMLFSQMPNTFDV